MSIHSTTVTNEAQMEIQAHLENWEREIQTSGPSSIPPHLRSRTSPRELDLAAQKRAMTALEDGNLSYLYRLLATSNYSRISELNAIIEKWIPPFNAVASNSSCSGREQYPGSDNFQSDDRPHFRIIH